MMGLCWKSRLLLPFTFYLNNLFYNFNRTNQYCKLSQWLFLQAMYDSLASSKHDCNTWNRFSCGQQGFRIR